MGRRLVTALLAALVLVPALPSGPLLAQQPVTIRGHASATGADVTHTNALLVHVYNASHISGGGSGGAVTQSGEWNVRHITSVTHVMGSVQIRNQAGTAATFTGTAIDVNCTGCSSASSVSVTHISSVTHVALQHLSVNQSGLWSVTSHQGGEWNIRHISGVTHVVMQHLAVNQLGFWSVTSHVGTGSRPVNQSGSWTVQAAHQGGEWNVRHITSVTHVGQVAPWAVVQSAAQGPWNVTAHQGGQWNIQHLSTGAHVVTNSNAPLHVVSNTGSGNMTCHSTAPFATSATGIIIHAAGAANRIFICSILLVSHSTGQSVSFLEGTQANCVLTAAPLIGSTVSSQGLHLVAGGGFAMAAPFPFLVTATPGNNVCLHLSASGRVSGTVTYRGGP